MESMESDDHKLCEAVRTLAEALETMLNLIKADALPTTPEARRLTRRARAFLEESAGPIAESDRPDEILSLATAISGLVISAREQILDDAVAASPVPDHPDV